MAGLDGDEKENKAVVEGVQEHLRNFDVNSILRGVQLTIVGATRALHNPRLFNSDIYRQAWLAVAAGIVIIIMTELPIFALKLVLQGCLLVLNCDTSRWENDVIAGLNFLIKTILQLPYILLSLLRFFLIGPYLDDMFMVSLEWIDRTYALKHESDDPSTLRNMYYENLKRYPNHPTNGERHKRLDIESAERFISKFGFRAFISLAAYLLSFLPILGRFTLPLTSFFTFKEAVGLAPACLIFSVGLLLPRQYLALFLQTYFGSRSLMRQLLGPYLKRVQFSKEQQRRFFRDREGVFFGFGIGFYFFLKIPIFGVFVYGIAEAATAYLVTKVTDPPSPTDAREVFAQSQTRWTNKKEFLRIPLIEFYSRRNLNMPTEEPDIVNSEAGEDRKIK